MMMQERRHTMRTLITTTAIGVLLSLTLTLSLMAQEEGVRSGQDQQEYKSRYSKELFDAADTNQDGYIDWDEARAFSKAIEQDPMGRKLFNGADVDNDGRLSVQEAKKYKHFETRHSEEVEKKTQQLKGTVDRSGETGKRMSKKEAIDVKKPHNKERVLEKKRNTRKKRNRDRDKSGTENDR